MSSEEQVAGKKDELMKKEERILVGTGPLLHWTPHQ
jgi:hypothetical protein